MRLAVLTDFHGLEKRPWVEESELEVNGKPYRPMIEGFFPRLDVEKVLGYIVVEQGIDNLQQLQRQVGLESWLERQKKSRRVGKA